MRRISTRVILVVVVLLAGCSAVSAPEPRVPAVTPAAVPMALPTGLTEEGVTNVTSVVAGHVAALSNTTAIRVDERTVRFENGTVLRTNRTTWGGTDARLVVVRSRGSDDAVEYARWQNASLVVGWVERNGHRQYYTLDRSSPPVPGVDPAGDHLLAALTRQRQASVRAVDCREARCLHVSFVLDERPVWGDDYPATGPVRYDLTVTTDGLVSDLVVTWTTRVADESVTVRERVAFRGVGETTADAPDWVAEHAVTHT